MKQSKMFILAFVRDFLISSIDMRRSIRLMNLISGIVCLSAGRWVGRLDFGGGGGGLGEETFVLL